MAIPSEVIAANVSSTGWDILLLLKSKEFLPHLEIRNKLKLSQLKAQVEIARLEGPALIVSNRSEEDKRSINYKLTEYGFEILNYKK